MDKQENQPNVYIVGAGISGLIAAITLEKYGIHPTILEAADRVGGRVKTDIHESYQLDHGFQVLLDAYPKAKEYLDYDALELQVLAPGAIIFNQGKSYRIGDPLRNLSFLIPSLFSSVGSLGDKLKILSLNGRLKGKTLDSIFESTEKTTYQYLLEQGFSEKIIQNFFQPFFSGIYLEPHLDTSSRMFEFVYKMFGEGLAVIPKEGIEAIPKQLASQLKHTKIQYNQPVGTVTQASVTLASGEKLASDFTIVTTSPETLIANYHSSLEWKSCDNLYFEAPDRAIKDPIIGLNANGEALVNNIFYPTSIENASRGTEELLSVTVVKDHDLEESVLIEKIQQELKQDFGISNTKFLRRYQIPHALPKLNDLQYQREPSESLINEKIAIAGDQLLNGSLNAAMIAGESAALAALVALEKNR